MDDMRRRSHSVVDNEAPVKRSTRREETMTGRTRDGTEMNHASLITGRREEERGTQRVALPRLQFDDSYLTPSKLVDRYAELRPSAAAHQPVRIPPMPGRITPIHPDRGAVGRYVDDDDYDFKRFAHIGKGERGRDDFLQPLYPQDSRAVKRGIGREDGHEVRVVRKDAMERLDDQGVSGDRLAPKGSGIDMEKLDTPGDEWREAYTVEGGIYYYNRRTRERGWSLPPTATYINDSTRPTGYRIFVPASRGTGVDACIPSAVSNVSGHPRDDRGTGRKTWTKEILKQDAVVGNGVAKDGPAVRGTGSVSVATVGANPPCIRAVDRVHSARKGIGRRGDALGTQGKGGMRKDEWFEVAGDGAREGGDGTGKGTRGGHGVDSSGRISRRDKLSSAENATHGGDVKGEKRTRVGGDRLSSPARGGGRGTGLTSAREAWTSPVDRPESWQKTGTRHGGTLEDERKPAWSSTDEAFRQEGRGETCVVSANPMKPPGHVEGSQRCRSSPTSSFVSDSSQWLGAYPQTREEFAFSASPVPAAVAFNPGLGRLTTPSSSPSDSIHPDGDRNISRNGAKSTESVQDKASIHQSKRASPRQEEGTYPALGRNGFPSKRPSSSPVSPAAVSLNSTRAAAEVSNKGTGDRFIVRENSQRLYSAVSPCPNLDSPDPFDEILLAHSISSPVRGRFSSALEENEACCGGSGNHSVCADEGPASSSGDGAGSTSANAVREATAGSVATTMKWRRGKVEVSTVSGPPEDAAQPVAVGVETSVWVPIRPKAEESTSAARVGSPLSSAVVVDDGTVESGSVRGATPVTAKKEGAETTAKMATTIVATADRDVLQSIPGSGKFVYPQEATGPGSDRNGTAAGYSLLQAEASLARSHSSTPLIASKEYTPRARVKIGGGEALVAFPLPVRLVAENVGDDYGRRQAASQGRRQQRWSCPDDGKDEARPSSPLQRTEKGCASSTTRITSSARAPGTPATAIPHIPRGGLVAEAATRSTIRHAAAGGVMLGTGDSCDDDDHDLEGDLSSLPGSSVVRHRVRRQLFSEKTQARPLVFCPFCGDGILAPGGLKEHLETCYVFARSRGGQTHLEVETAIRAMSGTISRGKREKLSPNATRACGNRPRSETTPAEKNASAHEETPYLEEATSSANVPIVKVDNNALDSTEEAPEDGREEGSGRRATPFRGPVETSPVVAVNSGLEVERCEGCGRTFAPGRLASHAKACRSVFQERRLPYDPKAMRAKGTPLEFFQPSVVTAPIESTGADHKAKGFTGFPWSARGNSNGEARNNSSLATKAEARNLDGADARVLGRTRSNPRASKISSSRKLPPVEGSAQCPFCSEFVPRVKLSVHLLKCKNLRSTRSDRTAPKALIKASSLSSVGNHSAGLEAKVRCPHCLRGFSPSAAPTHIAICAKVENRPKSAFASRGQIGARKGRAFSMGPARVERKNGSPNRGKQSRGGPDGSSVVLMGDTRDNKTSAWIAAKLDEEGNFLWSWEDNSTYWWLDAVEVGKDGTVVMAGGNVSRSVVIKLDADGNLKWRYERYHNETRACGGLLVMEDGSVVVAGEVDEGDSNDADFSVHKLDVDGSLLWEWQDGTDGDDAFEAATVSTDSTAVLAGFSCGSWSIVNRGSSDFVAVKLAADGSEMWRWQDGSEKSDAFLAATAGDDGSVILAGFSGSGWEGENRGEEDFAAVKLDADGAVLWKWQDGTDAEDRLTGAVMSEDGKLFLRGYTKGAWDGSDPGDDYTFAGVELDLADGTELRRWQNDVPANLRLQAIVRGDGSRVVVEGFAPENWSRSNFGEEGDSLAVERGMRGEGVTSETVKRRLSSSSGIIIAVICVIVVAVVIGAAAFVYFWRRRRSRADRQGQLEEEISTAYRHGDDDPVMPSAQPSYAPRNASSPDYSDVVFPSRIRNRVVLNPTPAKPEVEDKPRPMKLSLLVPGPALPREERNPSYGAGTTEPFSTSGFPLGLSTVQEGSPNGAGDDGVEQPESRQGSLLMRRRKDSRSDSMSVEGVGIVEALLDAAKEIADHSSIPIVGEAASLVSILVKLLINSVENPSGLEVKLKRCRSIVLMLRRAAKVLEKESETSTEAERVLIEDVFDAVEDLVELIKTFESKNRLGQIISSSLFKRRVDEAEVLIDSTILRLQMSLNVHIGHKVNEVGHKLEGVRDDVQQTLLLQRKALEGPSATPAEVADAGRLMRRKRNLEQIEIPEDDVEISKDMLGKGGFGAVYIADYGGRNAAAKVMQVEHCIGGNDTEKMGETQPSQPSVEHARRQRKAFLRELEAMMRLRSPHTVNVYGAITSRKDRLVLVMELMAGGDLRTFLKTAQGPIPKEKAWLIMKDISAGVAFLHSKNTVHGDLKSANVLFDGQGRAKIGDFGTCRWTHNSTITGLATYTTKGGQNTQMSFAWAAPEVLNAGKPSYASDVYSLGVVVWEIVTREMPWGSEPRPRQIMSRVLNGYRLMIPGDCPADLADIFKACWVGNPAKRPSSAEVTKRIKALD